MAQAVAVKAGQAANEARQVWKLSFQLTPDRSVPAIARYPLLWKLSYKREEAITRYVLTRMVRMLASETKAGETKTDRIKAEETGKAGETGLFFGPGGYKQNPLAPSAQWDVRGAPEEIQTLEEAIGVLAKQYEVIASRPDPLGETPAFDLMQSRENWLHDPKRLQQVWNRIGERAPRLHQGFLPLKIDGQACIRIINTEEPWTDSDTPLFQRAVAELGAEFHTEFVSHRLRVRFKPVINDWKLHPKGDVTLRSLRDRGHTDLADRLVKRYRPRVAQWTLEALHRYAK